MSVTVDSSKRNSSRSHLYSTRAKIGLESAGFVVAEGLSALTGLGVVAVADVVIPKPMLKAASKCLAKVVIEPFLEPIEGALSKICKLEECQVDSEKPREVRAEQLAKTVILFGSAFAASLAVKLHTRRAVNDYFGINTDDHVIKPHAGASTWEKVKHYGTLKHWTPQEKVIFAVDEGMHLGALYALNNTLAPFTDRQIRHTTGTLQKIFGWTEAKAHEVASMAWIWEAANAAGAASGIGIIIGNHTMDLSRRLTRLIVPESHTERLARRAAQVTQAPPIP